MRTAQAAGPCGSSSLAALFAVSALAYWGHYIRCKCSVTHIPQLPILPGALSFARPWEKGVPLGAAGCVLHLLVPESLKYCPVAAAGDIAAVLPLPSVAGAAAALASKLTCFGSLLMQNFQQRISWLWHR